MTTCAQGFGGKAAFLQGSSPYTWANGLRMPFYREQIQFINTISPPDVIYGTRTIPSERARFGPGVYGGWIYLPVSPKELDTLLPLIMGANESADVFALAETVPAFGLIMEKVTDAYGYHNGAVNQAIFSATQAGAGATPNYLTLALQCWFKDEDATVTFPALTLSTDSNYVPYVFEDSTVTLDGAARTPKAWRVHIHNHIHPRYVASLKAVTLCAARRTVAAQFQFPWDDDHDDLHIVARAGIAGSMALTNGGLSTTFTFGRLQAPSNTPFITGHDEIDKNINFVARGVSTTLELEINNDSVA